MPSSSGLHERARWMMPGAGGWEGWKGGSLVDFEAEGGWIEGLGIGSRQRYLSVPRLEEDSHRRRGGLEDLGEEAGQAPRDKGRHGGRPAVGHGELSDI